VARGRNALQIDPDVDDVSVSYLVGDRDRILVIGVRFRQFEYCLDCVRRHPIDSKKGRKYARSVSKCPMGSDKRPTASS